MTSNQKAPKIKTATIRVYPFFGTRHMGGSVLYRGRGPHIDYVPTKHIAMETLQQLAKRCGFTHYRLDGNMKRFGIDQMPSHQELAASIT
ncbi:MAG: hypothetical protein Q7S87_08635 [Agitococcus sp.]|nr:hypothetical protein [Agitococcus sp.]MDO9177636.1 hypothetical protein [Agitococcus sp.]